MKRPVTQTRFVRPNVERFEERASPTNLSQELLPAALAGSFPQKGHETMSDLHVPAQLLGVKQRAAGGGYFGSRK